MYKTLLAPCDFSQLEPFQYPWAWDMARECEQNNWAPEEIQVAPDVADYRDPTLDPLHKHVFESIMAQLTTFDILRGDDAAETFLQILQPAEIKHFFKRLIWEEALHTRSYRYIIENLGIDPEIYTRWQRVPVMAARVEYSNKISEPLCQILAAREITNASWTSNELAPFVLRALIWWFLVFEGVWFWVNLLGPIQQLARLGRFRGAAEQFSYIARDEAQHIRFGVELIKRLGEEHPRVYTKELLLQIKADFLEGIRLEEEYAQYFLNEQALVGYNVADHIETAKYLANMRLRSIGLEELFPDAKHCFPWFSEVLELKKEKNFFETRVTDYRTGGALSFEDGPDGFDSVM